MRCLTRIKQRFLCNAKARLAQTADITQFNTYNQ